MIHIKQISKYSIEKIILIPIILLGLISIISIYSTKSVLGVDAEYLWLKQLIWYIIGFIIALTMMKIGNKFFYNNAWWLYFFGIVLLILVLFFGIEINNAKCWFKIPYIGTLQPSEFMKVFLIIILARLINEFNETYITPTIMDEFKFLLKILVIIIVPSVLTFIENDTGAVMMYFIITFLMLFIGGLKKRWFVSIILFFGIFIILFISIYLINKDLFISIFGTNFFYRIDRIINWSNSSGLQLSNSLTAIGSAGLFGHGFNNVALYFPEMQTDFIFSVYTSCFGLIGAIILISIIIYFDINIINTVNKTTNMTDKYMIGGVLAILIFQQVYNISMTIGLLPIMGITLPFISYGGSSLISYMLLLGFIFNVSNEKLRFTN